MKKTPFDGLHYRSACELWLKEQWGQLAPRTILDYSRYLLIYDRIFPQIAEDRSIDYKTVVIEVIDSSWMRDYQSKRKAQGVGHGTINKELTVLNQVREEMSDPIEGYRLLKMPKDYEGPGRRLEPEEKKLWIRVCKAHADDKKLEVAALTSLLQISSGLGPGEIKCARLKDVQLGDEPALYVSPAGAKRKRRERLVEVEEEGEWALRKLVERCHRLVGKKPHYYLVPGYNSRGDHKYNGEKMCSSWRQGMKALLAIADTHFRNYDQRHHAISEALQDARVSQTGASQHFGHISQRMWRKYYHGNRETSRIVARAIVGKQDGGIPRKKPSGKVNPEGNGAPVQGSFTYSAWSPHGKK